MKNNTTITCYADLEREELRVRKRLKKQEAELQQRIKRLPEEIVTIGVTKAITGVISGNFMKTATSIFRNVVSYFFGKRENSGGGFFKKIFADVVQNFSEKEKED